MHNKHTLSEENKEMLRNQAVELIHHADELISVLEKSEYIEPWVLAKAERATTDLSDITHYLEGNSHKMGDTDKFEDGGYMAKGGETSIMTIGIDKSNVLHPIYFVYDRISGLKKYGFETREEAKKYIQSKGSRMSNGGYMAKGGKVVKVNNSDLLEIGNTHNQRKVIKDLIPILNKNGIKLRYGTSIGKSPQAILFDYKHQDGILYISGDGWYGSVTYMGEEISDASDLDYLIKNPPQDEEYASGGMMAKGGKVYVDLFEHRDEMPYKVEVIVDKYEDEYGEDIPYQSLLDMQRDVEEVGYTFDFGLDSSPYGLRPMGVDITQLRDYDGYGDDDDDDDDDDKS